MTGAGGDRVVICDGLGLYRLARWRRVRALNALGFSVGEIVISPTADGNERLAVRVGVSDRSHHRRLLHALTGLETHEHQAR